MPLAQDPQMELKGLARTTEDEMFGGLHPSFRSIDQVEDSQKMRVLEAAEESESGVSDERMHLNSWPLDEVDPRKAKFPCCIVWTPLPVVSWLAPFIGHVGICREDGAILDFSGSNFVNIDNFAYGAVARYLQLEREQVYLDQFLQFHTLVLLGGSNQNCSNTLCPLSPTVDRVGCSCPLVLGAISAAFRNELVRLAETEALITAITSQKIVAFLQAWLVIHAGKDTGMLRRARQSLGMMRYIRVCATTSTNPITSSLATATPLWRTA